MATITDMMIYCFNIFLTYFVNGILLTHHYYLYAVSLFNSVVNRHIITNILYCVIIFSIVYFKYVFSISTFAYYLKFIIIYILCIIYDFVDNIKIYFFIDTLHNEFALTLLFYKLCSIFNDKNKLGALAIIFKYIN